MNALAFIAGLSIGACLGVLVMAAMVADGRADDAARAALSKEAKG